MLAIAIGLSCCVQGEYEGDVLEGLFECVSSSGRFRTASSSSVTFAVPSLSSCDIFPEIAGVVSASDSETDAGDCLVAGRDYLHAAELVFSPPQQPKLRRNSAKQSEDSGDASVMEMLDTLCYTTHDLTHINDVVQNVVLDWQSGAAVESGLTADEIVVKTEPSCENTQLNGTVSLMKNEAASLPEGGQYETGDVLEGLLDYVSESGHFEAPSSSPVSGNARFGNSLFTGLANGMFSCIIKISVQINCAHGTFF